MYLPRTFEETDSAKLNDFIARHPLATLVRMNENGLCADHIPMLIEAEAAGVVLRGHVARANPLWCDLGAGAQALAIFQDAGGYITPSWYASKRETGKVVPTWNYIAVHAYGTARAVDDAQWLREFLTRLTAAHESHRQPPWLLTDAPEDYIATQLKAIVGIELRVTRIEGKWKMSQNRLPHDIDGVIAGLRSTGDTQAAAMAAEVEARRPRR